MKKIKIIAHTCFILSIGLFTLISCESDADALGKQFTEGNAADGQELSYDVIAYNVNHNDSIRSDAKHLGNLLLGAFDEPVFGKHKASYVTQLRPTVYGIDFGKKAKVDSVVLQIKPNYKIDSVKTTNTTLGKTTSGKDSIKTVSTYPLLKYGKGLLNAKSTKLTLRVEEVSDFLYDQSRPVYSNHRVNTGTFLGKKVIGASVSGVKIVQSGDNRELLTREVGIRIPLNKDFFQTKIIGQQGQNALSDAASFIRYFRGIRISVDENDGFLFSMAPDDISITMYYSNEVTKDGQTKREANTYTFDLGKLNVHFSQLEFSRPSGYNTAMKAINTVKGDAKLYLQGAGGAGGEFIIPESTIQQLKNIYAKDKAGILSAKIRVYSDANTWHNNFAKPSTYTVLQKNRKQFIEDMNVLNTPSYIRVKAVNLDKNPSYYDIAITQTLKNIVEKGANNQPIVIDVGDFATLQKDNRQSLLGWNYTSRAYTPNRVVLVGSDPANPKQKAQLKVVYTKK
ncbi:DUF4270 family protein [Elizabethkingia argentiflava]|uniref:DUF4270 family protein n=1 Tax=Elizabethkingia argenteiflava TaxID=2681556 RepID=A0A845PVF3_9FLAO|nr:DUF4270 domain-containing protein [Elizabethkingia argenteiflava]NAW50457.1 DUF4270 family protein [Elizabethkingia argenteiflava]